MVQLRMIHNLHDGAHSTRLRIIGTVNQTLDTSVHHRTGAHGARFNCNKQIAVSQAIVINRYTGFAESYDLRVGSRVAVRDVAVSSTTDNFSFTHNDRANRDFSQLESTLSAAEGLFHPKFIKTNVSGWWSMIVRHVGRFHNCTWRVEAKIGVE
jgi:hypothetical protein